MTTTTTGSMDTSSYPAPAVSLAPMFSRPGRGDPPGRGVPVPGRDRLGIADLRPDRRDRQDPFAHTLVAAAITVACRPRGW